MTLNYTSAIFLALYLALAGWRLNSGIVWARSLVGLLGVALLLRPTLHADQLTGGLIGLGSGVLAGMAYFSVRELGARGEPETRTVFYFSLVSSLGAGALAGCSANCTRSTCAAACSCSASPVSPPPPNWP